MFSPSPLERCSHLPTRFYRSLTLQRPLARDGLLVIVTAPLPAVGRAQGLLILDGQLIAFVAVNVAMVARGIAWPTAEECRQRHAACDAGTSIYDQCKGSCCRHINYIGFRSAIALDEA